MFGIFPRWLNPFAGLFKTSFSFGGDDNDSVTETRALSPIQLPDYAEATGARQNWWDTLQKWQTQPDYGAIAPNWNDIWENARQKVQRYFMGGPEGPGAIGTVRANLARRGESENPAAEASISRLGMQQGNVLSDLATNMAIQEATLGEQGRQNWLQSLMQLSGLKPSFMSGGSVTTRDTIKNPVQDSLFALGEGVAGGVGSGGMNFDWLNEIMDFGGMGGYGGGGGTPPITDITGTDIGDVASMFGGGGQGGGFFNLLSGFGEDSDWGDAITNTATDPATYQQLISLLSYFCWVAAELFEGSWGDPRTHYARHFIGNIGPKWFKKLYIKHGAKVADFIHDKPVLKAVIKPIFSAFALFGKLDLQAKGVLSHG